MTEIESNHQTPQAIFQSRFLTQFPYNIWPLNISVLFEFMQPVSAVEEALFIGQIKHKYEAHRISVKCGREAHKNAQDLKVKLEKKTHTYTATFFYSYLRAYAVETFSLALISWCE